MSTINKVNVVSYNNIMKVVDGTLKGQLCNHYLATTVGKGADGSIFTNGTNMFYECNGLTSWTADLPTLTNGTNMFYNCTGLTSWTTDLPNITNGDHMFSRCSNVASWTAALPNLTDGTSMFSYCSDLTSWTTDLPNLANGSYMFYECNALTSWTVDLSSLTNGTNMFYGCVLNEASVLRILNSIPAYTSGAYKLHLGKRTNYQNSTEIAALLNTTTPIAAASNYKYKGWTITVQA